MQQQMHISDDTGNGSFYYVDHTAPVVKGLGPMPDEAPAASPTQAPSDAPATDSPVTSSAVSAEAPATNSTATNGPSEVGHEQSGEQAAGAHLGNNTNATGGDRSPSTTDASGNVASCRVDYWRRFFCGRSFFRARCGNFGDRLAWD